MTTEIKSTKSVNHNNDKNRFKAFVVIVLMVASFFAGSAWNAYKHKSDYSENAAKVNDLFNSYHNKKQPSDVDLSIFWEVWNIAQEKYIDKSKLDKEKLIYGAVTGMVKAIGDPFSNFLTPDETKSFAEDMQGSFEGIGVEIGMKNEVLTVIAPIEGSPGAKAGLKPGDKIIKINDDVTVDLSVEEAVKMIRGPKGTEVRLTVLSEGSEKPKEVSILRDIISIKSVRYEFKENGKIAYVKIIKFGDDTTQLINSISNEIITAGAKGIIIDLRNNPGGYLETAVDVCSRFIPKGKLVVAEENYEGKRNEFNAKGGNILSSLPVVVLINNGSASASEIMAGALRDQLNVKLIGKKTFGKGSVQELEKLDDGSSLKITVAKWLTPKGESIMEKGLSPDIEVEMTENDVNQNRDPQLEKAIEIVNNLIRNNS